MPTPKQKKKETMINITIRRTTKAHLNDHKQDSETFDGTINRLMTGRTEKERKYNPILKKLSEDEELIAEIHDNAQKLRDTKAAISENSCYATATYVCLRRVGINITIKQTEELLGVCKDTIRRYYRNLI
jgi:uncharacterized protein YfdQ (DUF2303 family)